MINLTNRAARRYVKSVNQASVPQKPSRRQKPVAASAVKTRILRAELGGRIIKAYIFTLIGFANLKTQKSEI